MNTETSDNRTAFLLIAFLSACIVGFLFWLIYFQEPLNEGVGGRASWLPAFNAFCNGLSATFVTLGVMSIRAGQKRRHGMLMLGATVASACFFIGYLVYHSLHGDSRFTGEGWIRPVYYFILISHIILSIAVVPMVLTTLYLAARRQWSSHRKLARWTYPVWLYVSVTGIVVFVLLRLI